MQSNKTVVGREKKNERSSGRAYRGSDIRLVWKLACAEGSCAFFRQVLHI